jgi:hypothetical protein
VGDLERFLAALGLEHYAAVLAENDVDLDILSTLSDGDLKELGPPSVIGGACCTR